MLTSEKVGVVLNESTESGSVKCAVLFSGGGRLELSVKVVWRGGWGVGAAEGSGVVARVVIAIITIIIITIVIIIVIIINIIIIAIMTVIIITNASLRPLPEAFGVLGEVEGAVAAGQINHGG